MQPLDLYSITDRGPITAPSLADRLEVHDQYGSELARELLGTTGLEAHDPGYCPNQIPLDVEATDATDADRYWKPCNAWGCPHCADRKRRSHTAHFSRVYMDRARSGQSLVLLTLTLDPKSLRYNGQELDQIRNRKYLMDCWSRYRKQLNRAQDKLKGSPRLAYTCSVEQHESGRFHLHVVLASNLGPKELRERWFSVGGGVVADVSVLTYGGDLSRSQERRLARVLGYVIKYAVKDAADGGFGNTLRSSQGIGYNSARAKAERFEHVAPADRYEVQEALGTVEDVMRSDPAQDPVRVAGPQVAQAVIRELVQPGDEVIWTRTGETLEVLSVDDDACCIPSPSGLPAWVPWLDVRPVHVELPRMIWYHIPVAPSPKPSLCTLTDEDRKVFEQLDRTARSRVYVQKLPDGSRTRYRMDSSGTLHVEQL